MEQKTSYSLSGNALKISRLVIAGSFKNWRRMRELHWQSLKMDGCSDLGLKNPRYGLHLKIFSEKTEDSPESTSKSLKGSFNEALKRFSLGPIKRFISMQIIAFLLGSSLAKLCATLNQISKLNSPLWKQSSYSNGTLLFQNWSIAL